MIDYRDSQRVHAEITTVFRVAAGSDEELQACLARYACILASGYLETACREMVLAFVDSKAAPEVVRYVESTLSQFRSPNTDKILQLLSRLDSECRSALEAQVSDELKDSVDSISANRHNIAHGRGSAVSLARMQKYYADARTVMSKARQALQP